MVLANRDITEVTNRMPHIEVEGEVKLRIGVPFDTAFGDVY